MCSAPLFHDVMMPFRSLLTIASSEDATRAARWSAAAGPCDSTTPYRILSCRQRMSWQRQPYHERSAAPIPIAARLDRPAVQLDEVPRDGEAEPEASVPPGGGPVGLAELFEHEREECRRDADAGVGHRQLCRPVGDSDGD